MPGKLLPMFATNSDLAKLLAAAESKMAVAFFNCGLVEKNTVASLGTSTQFMSAVMSSGRMAPALLVVLASEHVVVREIPLKKGGMNYAVDQMLNPNSICISPGGMVNPMTLLKGQIDTISDTPESLALFAAFGKIVRRQFAKIQSYWVGPEALEFLDSGGRLTANIKAAAEYDLKR